MPWTRIVAEREAQQAVGKDAHQEGVRTLTYRDAIREALELAMEADPAVLVMGEGVDDPGGSFGTTLGLAGRFGADRVMDTPLAENGVTGVAAGAAMMGLRPVLVHLRVDFLPMAMDQMVNHAAKWRYMFGGRQRVPLVVRAIIGRGWGSGAQHSQSVHGAFMQFPGLKVVLPATPADAKGLLLAAIADPDPVLVIEHRWLYDHSGPVPEGMHLADLGRAAVRRPGRDVTLAAVSHMVPEALAAAETLAARGVDAEVLDLRSVSPVDAEGLLASLERTGRLVVADTGHLSGGLTAEVAACASGPGFGLLKAPVERVGLPPCPTPASPVLEEAYYPGREDILAAAGRTLAHGKGRP